jgi:hypothetical protein
MAALHLTKANCERAKVRTRKPEQFVREYRRNLRVCVRCKTCVGGWTSTTSLMESASEVKG